MDRYLNEYKSTSLVYVCVPFVLSCHGLIRTMQSLLRVPCGNNSRVTHCNSIRYKYSKTVFLFHFFNYNSSCFVLSPSIQHQVAFTLPGNCHFLLLNKSTIYINVTLMYTSSNLLASAKATFWEHIGDRAERAITSQQNNNSLTIYVSL